MPGEPDDIVVYATLVKNVNITADDYLRFFLGPLSWSNVDLKVDTGFDFATVTTLLDNASVVLKPKGVNFEVLIDADDFNKLSPSQQKAVSLLVEYYAKDPALKAAFEKISDAHVPTVELRVGTDYVDADGVHHSWGTGDDAQANISFHETNNTIDAGTRIIININEAKAIENAINTTPDSFLLILAHEFLHPYFANPDPNDPGSDHAQVRPAALDATHHLIAAAGQAGELSSSSLGDAVLGSHFADVVNGGSGDDVFAGLGGNDTLSGGGGHNTLIGGLGLDTLVSDGSGDQLLGGLDADHYVVNDASILPFIQEDGGVDYLSLTGDVYSYQYYRVGSSLEITRTDGVAYTDIMIDGFYNSGDSGRVEYFDFNGSMVGASYIEYLAAGGHRDDQCYDESGQYIVCNPYGTPVVIDFHGDGVGFISASQSNVRFDVDGDGILDRLAWVSSDDGVLFYDRNGDGTVSGFNELTFVHDLRGAGSDLEGLIGFDGNHDGVIDSSDAVFSQLFVWSDTNGDGISQSAEISTIKALGLQGIDLSIEGRLKLDENDEASQILGSARLIGSSEARALDVAFHFDKGEIDEREFDKGEKKSFSDHGFHRLLHAYEKLDPDGMGEGGFVNRKGVHAIHAVFEPTESTPTIESLGHSEVQHWSMVIQPDQVAVIA